MSAAKPAKAVTLAEARRLFAPFEKEKSLTIAVSGGPDSTALLYLASRWRHARESGPSLMAVTVDHGLRAESSQEAKSVRSLARALDVPHRTLRWQDAKPKPGVQEAARDARYSLLAEAARKAGARYVLTAHTLDDQAETVLLRLLRGSGPAGLRAMSAFAPCPGHLDITLARPLLAISKARLIATVMQAGLSFVEDASNRDPRYTRARLRTLMPALEQEGLTATRLARLAARFERMEAALRSAVARAAESVSLTPWREGDCVVLERERFERLPEEIALRLLGQAIAHVGDEGPLELGKLERLYASLRDRMPKRRTLAGALVSAGAKNLTIERAPARRSRALAEGRISALTTGKTPQATRAPGG